MANPNTLVDLNKQMRVIAARMLRSYLNLPEECYPDNEKLKEILDKGCVCSSRTLLKEGCTCGFMERTKNG